MSFDIGAFSGVTPDAVLEAGHTEQIRTFQWMGQAIATGGEDAKICSWRVRGGEGENGDMAPMGGPSDRCGGGIDDDVAMDDGR